MFCNASNLTARVKMRSPTLMSALWRAVIGIHAISTHPSGPS
jgi:hypothetical protein